VVMTLSSFRIAPRQGHMDRAQRMVAYLAKMRHASIRSPNTPWQISYPDTLR